MTNALYPLAKEALLRATLDFPADTICAVLVAGYTYSAAHQFRSSLGSKTSAAVALTGKTVTGGVFDADDTTFLAVPGQVDGIGSPLDYSAVVLFKDTGTSATSPLIAYLDVVTGLPFLGTGSDVTVTWDAGTSRIFAV